METLQSLADRHTGRRCFIVGNGPSLQGMNLGLLEGERFFAVNRGYLAREIGLPPIPYLVISDPGTYKAYWQEIREIEVGLRLYRTTVTDLPEYRDAPHREAAIEVPYHEAPGMEEGHFATDLTQGMYRGYTVVLDAAQIAFHMGFTSVFFIGVDLTSTLQQTHFYETAAYEQSRIDDMPKDKVRQSFRVALEVFHKHGRRLVNATEGGTLDELPRASFDSLFC